MRGKKPAALCDGDYEEIYSVELEAIGEGCYRRAPLPTGD